MRNCRIFSLEGEIDYFKGLMLQRSAAEAIKQFDADDHLFLLRHKPTITKGHFAREGNILVSKEYLQEKGIKVFSVSRGGDVTYHGHGQLMGYPIIDLRRKNLTNYKAKLCETIIALLKEYKIEGEEGHKELTGIWVGNLKIASIGYEIKKIIYKNEARIITMHGFALYVLDEMEEFKYINPCGMASVKLTCMERILKREIDFKALKERYVKHFSRIFQYKLKKETV